MIARKGKDAPILGTYLVARNVIFRFWLPIAVGADVISPSTGFAVFGAGAVLDLAAVVAQEHVRRKNRSRPLSQTLRNLRGEHRTAALHQQYLNRLYMQRHRVERTKSKKQLERHRGHSKLQR